MRSALLAIQIALLLGVIGCAGQVWVVIETIKDWRAVTASPVNGDLRRIARWSAFIAPLVLALFLFMTYLALSGVLAGEPETITAIGLALRWSYAAIMAVTMTWSVGDLLVRRQLSSTSFLVEDEVLRGRIVSLEERVEGLNEEVNRRPTREQLLADNDLLRELVARQSKLLDQ